MTSLQGSLPDSASGLWRMDREYGVSNTRVKHVVIHEAHIREAPDRHVVYRIDVFTTERNWCVYRRYSEFRKLHEKISDSFKMFKGSFPPKQLSGNLSPAIIEQRRSALEHYLLKIINCHNQDVASCNTVLRFLDLHHNDVYYVTSGLCRYVKTFGEAILNESHYFVLSPTQLFCVHKRLRIPNSDADYKADSVFCDLGSLYDFVSRLSKVCIKPANLQDQGIRCELTLLKNIKELHIQTFSVSLIKGLSTVQLQLQRLKACQAVTAMKDLLIDCVLEKKTQPKAPEPLLEGTSDDTRWRQAFNSKAIFNTYTIHPWISLLYLDLSHNSIRQLDDSFSLLPNLQELDLSHNQIEILDLNYTNPNLTKITCTHCNVMKVITKLHENLSELLLSHNKITELTGFNKLVVLRKVNLVSNCVTSLDNVACLTDLPRLHDIALADNPLSKKRSYRMNVLCMFTQACRRTDILVDGKGFSDKEKRKAKSTRVKGSTPHTPSDLPFFGNSSEHMPTAFAPQQEDMWNSILHDNSSSLNTNSVASSTGEEAEEEEAEALSPVLSDIRSTPSTRAAYDWDPAQAFASSANSTPPMALPALDYQQCSSLQGSSTCLDKTSSCDEECELGKPAKEDLSLEDVSPISDSHLKHFNSSYYKLSGSTEIYPSSSPFLHGSAPGGCFGASPKQRCNPFGEPAKRDTGSSSGVTTSDASRGDGSESSSDYHTGLVGEEASSRGEEASYSREEEASYSREGERSSSFGTVEDRAAPGEEDSLEFSTKLPGTPYRDLVSPPSTAYISPIITPAFTECASAEPAAEPAAEAAEEAEKAVEAAEEAAETAEEAEKAVETAEVATEAEVAEVAAEVEEATSVPEEVAEEAMMEENKPEEESFVVDRPDYDDIIFAGSCTGEVAEPDTALRGEVAEVVRGELDTVVPGEVDDVVRGELDTDEVLSGDGTQPGSIMPLPDNIISPPDNIMPQLDNFMPQSENEPQLENAPQSANAPQLENEPQLEFNLSPEPEPQELTNILAHNLNSSNLQEQETQVSQSAPSTDAPAQSDVFSNQNLQQTVLPSNSQLPTNNQLPSNQLPSNSTVLRPSSTSPDSPVLPTGTSPGASVSPVLPAGESPVSPSLTDRTSSGDECMRANKILSLSCSFGPDADIADLYDSEDSEEHSEELTFSGAKLQF